MAAHTTAARARDSKHQNNHRNLRHYGIQSKPSEMYFNSNLTIETLITMSLLSVQNAIVHDGVRTWHALYVTGTLRGESTGNVDLLCFIVVN